MDKYEALRNLLADADKQQAIIDAHHADAVDRAFAREQLQRIKAKIGNSLPELRALLADVRERDEVIILTQLNEIHSAMDRGLGDSGPTHVENDSDLKREYPLYWAAFKLAKLIQSLESNK